LFIYLFSQSCEGFKNRDGEMLKVVGQDDFFDMYKIRCHGDPAFGNTVMLNNPTDYYSNQMGDKYGYVFRFMDDSTTRGVYKTPKSAMSAYCANPSRTIRYV